VGKLNRKYLFGLVFLALLAIGVWKTVQTSILHKTFLGNPVTTTARQDSYWTCPMHPQIHSDHAGECPICHMKLVLVKGQIAHESEQDVRAQVQVTTPQLSLLGVQRYSVQIMDMKVKVPVAGRFTSSSTVVFQIYESDLRYIKAGLSFKGESSVFPEGEVGGLISSVDSIIDPTSRTVRAVGAVRKAPRGIIPETTFRGEIEIDLKSRIAIPESAVLHTGEKDLVYVFKNSYLVEPKTVKLGQKAEEFYEVIEGLNPSDVISSGPNFLIDSEAKIRGTHD
jgi:multidrug efflux pump subunit AcrA (membrane-fusion protein)